MKQIQDSDNRLLTRTEVAEIFQVDPSTIPRWAEAGRLPSVKTLGGHRRYEAKTIMKLVQYFGQKETNMDKASISVPAMYGDHHVLEVRRILLELSGVEEVNASSCFHTVEVSYDTTKVSVAEITARLDQAGYLGELAVPAETGVAVSQNGQRDQETFFRHTSAFEHTKQGVSFGQNVGYAGRALWPCPGLGVLKPAAAQEVTHG